MFAIQDDQGTLRWTDAPDGALRTPHDIRIRVHAAGVNRADLVQRAGHYAPPPGASQILGLEVAGEVVEAGPDAKHEVGDRVMALLEGGGYASEVVVDSRQCLQLPDPLSWVEGAAFMEVFCTAWLNLMEEGGLGHLIGGKALIHAGGSGVGTAAVQICNAFGHDCWITAGSDSKIQRSIELGAIGGSNRHHGAWIDDVRGWAEGGVDTILDPVGASYLDQNMRAVRSDGHIVVIGLMSGRRAELDMGRLLIKRIRLRGSTLRSRKLSFKRRLVQRVGFHLVPLLEDGRVTAIVDKTFPIEEAEAAHRYMASNESFGKIVLTL